MNALSRMVVATMAAWVAAGLGSALQAGETIDISDWSYGAIAYEPSTGEYHYSYNCTSRSEAERMALARCKAADAKILCWCQNGFLALARDADGKYHTGYSWGAGASSREAINYAHDTLDARTSRTILLLTTDGQYIFKSK